MKQDLTSLLQAVPFAAFTVRTHEGKEYTVNAAGEMCVGKDICVCVDVAGSLVAVPFHSIDRVIVLESECVSFTCPSDRPYRSNRSG
jgi:hypothetical protein